MIKTPVIVFYDNTEIELKDVRLDTAEKENNFMANMCKHMDESKVILLDDEIVKTQDIKKIVLKQGLNIVGDGTRGELVIKEARLVIPEDK